MTVHLQTCDYCSVEIFFSSFKCVNKNSNDHNRCGWAIVIDAMNKKKMSFYHHTMICLMGRLSSSTGLMSLSTPDQSNF